MDNVKTPIPKPKFFAGADGGFSTKKERRSPGSNFRWGPKSGSMGPRGKTAPPISRVHPRRWDHQPAHFISFKTHSDSLLTASRGPSFDDSQTETLLEQAFEVDKEPLGVGCFGEVFRARSRDDGRYYAVKRAKDRFRSVADRADKLREVQKHEGLPPHPNLVRFIRAWEDRGHLYIQTELCRSSLASLLEPNLPSVSEPLVWDFTVDLLLAVQHLHNHDLVHLDIKPENIFIGQDGICKLGDFGLVFDLRQQPLSSAQEGDAKYLAPELLRHHERPSKAADIFSLGITLLEIACDLDVPSSGQEWQDLRQNPTTIPDLKSGENLLTRVSPPMQQLIKDMLERDPLLRPSATNLLARPELQATLRRRRLLVSSYRVISTCKTFFLTFYFIFRFLIFFLLKPFSPLLHRFYTPLPTTSPATYNPLFHERDSEERWMREQLPSSRLHHVVQNLRFDDESDEDEGLGDVSSIPGSGDVLTTDEDESGHQIIPAYASEDSLPASPPFSSRLPSYRQRPFNSTPANQGKKRSRRVDPTFSHQPSPPPIFNFSPVGDGDGSPLTKRLPSAPRHWSPALRKGESPAVSESPLLRSSPEKSGGGDAGGGGDGFAVPKSVRRTTRNRAKPSPRKLRLNFDQHGSSSEDEG